MTIAEELAALRQASYRELQERHLALFGETPRPRNRMWLVKRIAWRIQANAEGDLSERAKQRCMELANYADLRIMAPRTKKAAPEQVVPVASKTASNDRLPMPGTVITRSYKGRQIQITVREEGLEFEGTIYKTLSAVAKAVTGTHCNGYLFFRLGGVK
jgi:Protein of unknown function (DUF2924)